MVAPGSWTLPVHASIFTGQLPIEHSADFQPGASVPGLPKLSVAPLSEERTTLAERFREAGYQTALISANPALHPSLGLARGFETADVSLLASGEEARVAPRVSAFLDSTGLDRSRPLFLTVNVILAHEPYEPVPSDVRWLPEVGETIHLGGTPVERTLVNRFYRSLLGPQEEEILQKLRAAYAWGVHLADRDLAEVLRSLRERGWLDPESVVVVTSDHGELLGENRELSHGRTLAPENVDVFAIVLGPAVPPGAVNHDLVQSQDIFPTLLEAALAERTAPTPFLRSLLDSSPARLAVSTSEPDPWWQELTGGIAGSGRLASVRTSSSTVEWSSLSGFKTSSPRGSPAEIRSLEALAIRIGTRDLERHASATDIPAELTEALTALGYVSP
jgi:hypothetical protein